MTVLTIDATGHSAADADSVYTLLRDGARWPACTPLGSFRLVREGDDEPEGLGAIRCFRTGMVSSYERIVELVPGRRFSYVLESGMPLRDYRADIDLEPTPEGTRITWHSRFEPKIPGTGWFYRAFLGSFIRRVLAGLAAAAATATSEQAG